MNVLRKIGIRLRSLFRYGQRGTELDEEIQSHVELRVEELMTQGAAEPDARHQARREFGHMDSAKEATRDSWGVRVITDTFRDIRFAGRSLRKSPGFALMVILIVGLGVGANTGIFSVLNALAWRPLPVRDPAQLRVVSWQGNLRPEINWTMLRSVFSYQTYEDFRQHASGVKEVFAFSDMSGPVNALSVSARGRADMANGVMVTDNYFQGLGLVPLLGQPIASHHDRGDAEPVTVISYAGWQRYFGGDPQAIGESVTLNRHHFKVIGVLPRGFQGLVPGEQRDFYVPMSAHALMREGTVEGTDYWWVQVMARLASDAEETQVCASLASVFAQAAADVRARDTDRRFEILLEDASSGLVAAQSGSIKSLRLLLALAGMVLLITCVNLAGLLLGRGTALQQEFAVRSALGAGRWPLIRKLLTEGLLLSLMGGILGVLLAQSGRDILVHLLLPPGSVLSLHTDHRVLAFALLIALATTLLGTLLPAIRSTGVGALAALKDRSSLGIPRSRLARTLVSLQIGLSLLLLMGAGLFARTLINLYRVDTGFNTNNLLVVEPGGLWDIYNEVELDRFHERFSAALRSLPGVVAVGRSNFPLLSGLSNNWEVHLPDESQRFHCKDVRVDASFLTTMGIPLLRGRHFNDSDLDASLKVVIVSQALAKAAYGADNPIGKTIRFGHPERDVYRIVGVCQDIKYDDIKQAPEPILFRLDSRCGCYMVRTAVNPQSLIPSVRKALAAINPSIPIGHVKTQSVQLDESIARERCFAALAIALAALALLLACMGLYSVMIYNVTRRRGEFGLRMALGAEPRDIAWPVLRSALAMVSVGLAVGLPAVCVLVTLIRSYLYNLSPYDPVALVGSMLLLTAVAVLAAWIPARRAARVHPMEALRNE